MKTGKAMFDVRKMTPQEVREAALTHCPADIREKILKIFSARQEFIKEMLEEGWIICPRCKAQPIEKERKVCAVCEYKLKAKRYFPAGRNGGKNL